MAGSIPSGAGAMFLSNIMEKHLSIKELHQMMHVYRS